VFVLGMISLGVIIGYVNSNYIAKTLENELINSSRMVALSIEEPVAENLFKEEYQALKNLIEKYRNFENVDYLIIENYDNEIVTHTFIGDVPPELKGANQIEDLTIVDAYNVKEISVPSLGKSYIDIIVPVKGGDLGFIRIGTDKNYINARVKNAIIYTVAVIILLMILGMVIALVLVTLKITRPIKYLADMAEKISLGDFDSPIKVDSRNEIGELADAIERMRESLKAAIDRLRKRQTRRI
jgi:methyl-accepting chemotaxis protein